MGWSSAAVAAVTAAASTAMAAKAQSDESAARVAVANQNAQTAAEAEGLAEQQNQLKLTQAIGKQRALYGASGVDPNTGSPIDANTQAAINASLNDTSIRFRTNTQIASDNFSANQARTEANDKITGDIFGFAAKAASAYGTGGASAGLSADEISTLNATSPGDI